jgi:hypothetical protein
MNLELIGQLIRLRYKLLWAKTRTRNGKIAIFVTGYFVFLLVAAILVLGGTGGGFVAAKSGQAERLAQGILTAFFFFALATSVMLGFGMNEIFADSELRRYPLCERERRFARHFTGVVDPFWLLVIALDLGLALGLYLFGAASFFLGMLAALMLLACNYLAARAVGMTMERIMQMKGGSLILPFAFMLLCLLPGTIMPLLIKSKGARASGLRILSFTPGFSAGSLMTRTDAAALGGFAALACWVLAFAAVLVLLERHPARKRVEAMSGAKWDSRFERLGALAGPRYAPLVTHWLQFYFRSKRFRISYLMSLALVPFLLFVWVRQQGKANPLAAAAGVFIIVGIAPAAAFVANQFGYVGSGFRRYFLFPMDPGDALRASSMTLMALCSVYIALTAACWVAFPPVAYGVRGFVMLLASGVFGLFAFHGAGLWTTLIGPRRCDPDKTMGNDLSLAGNLLVVGGMIATMATASLIAQLSKRSGVPDLWWISLVLAALAVCFYFVSLRAAAAAFSNRRERMLKIVEGKA